VVGRRRKITKKITENSKLGETWVLKITKVETSAKIQKKGHKRKNPKSCSKQISWQSWQICAWRPLFEIQQQHRLLGRLLEIRFVFLYFKFFKNLRNS